MNRGSDMVRRTRESQTRVHNLPIARVRPEEGLSRKRDESGHQELCQSIAQFGVLTPITVRPASDGSGDFFLVKGQGRTLACRILGLKTIPAIVVGEEFSDSEKVQQFLVENVTRLRMNPVDRALLVSRARRSGEETARIAERFGISASTVRKLEAQLAGASPSEIAALRRGSVTLASQGVIARFAEGDEREALVSAISKVKVSAADLQTLLIALGWRNLVSLGPRLRASRMQLLEWGCNTLASLPKGADRDRIRMLAARLPVEFLSQTVTSERLWA
jgi:ParB/RepB/Spo0J family partition protein